MNRIRTATDLTFLFALTGLFTLLNAVKPLQIDDACFYHYAVQISRKPLDPYGFSMFWYQHPEPAFNILTPPLLPYWWALAIRLFGEQPFFWKLWLLPFSLLFVFGLDALFRRYAAGQERTLTGLMVLSPVFLPSFNLMLDVPALALSLCAVVLFLKACDRGSPALAALAGVVAALAAETKYTGFLALAVILLYAWMFERLNLWLLCAFTTALLVSGWELFIGIRYGQSHFIHHLFHIHQYQPLLEQKAGLILPLVTMLGGLAPMIWLLSFAALGLRAWTVIWASLLVVLGYVGLATTSDAVILRFSLVYPSNTLEISSGRLGINHLAFNLFGIALCASVATVVWRLCSMKSSIPAGNPERGYRVEWFLALWLGLEVLGYFALSPFPAARRVMGVVVVATLLAGRQASRTCVSAHQRTFVQAIACLGALLGLLYWFVDWCEASAARQAVERVEQYVRQNDGSPTIWYVGHWGFQYYAEKADMRPVVPDQSVLKRGEWLVVPEVHRQLIELDGKPLELAIELAVEDRVTLRTVPAYYSGRTPMTHRSGPRLKVSIYRVVADFVPRTPAGVSDSHF